MAPVSGHGWAEKQDDDSLEAEICLEGAMIFPLSRADWPLLVARVTERMPNLVSPPSSVSV
jgi:hypothetical protein